MLIDIVLRILLGVLVCYNIYYLDKADNVLNAIKHGCSGIILTIVLVSLGVS